MKLITAATLAITALTALIITINAVVSSAARTAPRSPAAQQDPASRAIPVAVPQGARRPVLRETGISRPMGWIRPEYLPALARSQSLRLQVSLGQVRCRPDGVMRS